MPREMFKSNKYCCVSLSFSNPKHNKNNKIPFHRRKKKWVIKTNQGDPKTTVHRTEHMELTTEKSALMCIFDNNQRSMSKIFFKIRSDRRQGIMHNT